jgi:hypothetical protein
VRGAGAVLISRFDYAGRVDYETEDTGGESPTPKASPSPNPSQPIASR